MNLLWVFFHMEYSPNSISMSVYIQTLCRRCDISRKSLKCKNFFSTRMVLLLPYIWILSFPFVFNVTSAPFQVKQIMNMPNYGYYLQVEALAVQLTQREGELIQEKAEVKKLANFLKQVMQLFFIRLALLLCFAF